MKQSIHYLFTGGDFPSKADLQFALEWVEDFRLSMKERGYRVEYFSPWNSKIEKGSTVHVFGVNQMQNWIRLKLRSHKVLVYSLPNQPIYPSRIFAANWKIFLDKLRNSLKKAPDSHQLMLDSVDIYILHERQQKDFLRFISKEKIFTLPKTGKEAVDLLAGAIS
jgi:hypothetical protein